MSNSKPLTSAETTFRLAQNEAEEDQRLAERQQRLASFEEELKMQKAVVKLCEDGIIMDNIYIYIDW